MGLVVSDGPDRAPHVANVSLFGHGPNRSRRHPSAAHWVSAVSFRFLSEAASPPWSP
jgi:hypothetical protein